MGRRSLAEERKAEILDAFGRCVARFGLEGSSLERIAKEASMKRSILRHYIGNRDDLVNALASKVIKEYSDVTKAALEQLSGKSRAQQLVKFLLPDASVGSTEQLLIIESLIGAANQYPAVRKLVFEYVEQLIALVAKILGEEFPKTKASACWDAAYGLICISFNHESLRPLELTPKYLRAARAAAQRIISTCE